MMMIAAERRQIQERVQTLQLNKMSLPPIPTDVWHYIVFLHLPFADIIEVLRVCKLWSTIMSNPTAQCERMWRGLGYRETNLDFLSFHGWSVLRKIKDRKGWQCRVVAVRALREGVKKSQWKWKLPGRERKVAVSHVVETGINKQWLILALGSAPATDQIQMINLTDQSIGSALAIQKDQPVEVTSMSLLNDSTLVVTGERMDAYQSNLQLWNPWTGLSDVFFDSRVAPHVTGTGSSSQADSLCVDERHFAVGYKRNEFGLLYDLWETETKSPVLSFQTPESEPLEQCCKIVWQPSRHLIASLSVVAFRRHDVRCPRKEGLYALCLCQPQPSNFVENLQVEGHVTMISNANDIYVFDDRRLPTDFALPTCSGLYDSYFYSTSFSGQAQRIVWTCVRRTRNPAPYLPGFIPDMIPHSSPWIDHAHSVPGLSLTDCTLLENDSTVQLLGDVMVQIAHNDEIIVNYY